MNGIMILGSTDNLGIKHVAATWRYINDYNIFSLCPLLSFSDISYLDNISFIIKLEFQGRKAMQLNPN
jgi:hypothetical protein